MSLRISLFENKLKGLIGTFKAVVKGQKSITLEQIIDDMVSEGTGLTRPQTKAYLEKLFQLVRWYVENGYRVLLPIVDIHLTVSGVFEGAGDKFDKRKHQVNIRTTPGPMLREIAGKIKVETVDAQIPAPAPVLIIDLSTRENNSVLTPGGIARLIGENLNLDEKDPEQGIFLIPANRPKEFIRVDNYISVKAKEVYFVVPALEKNVYRLEVKATVKKSSQPQRGLLTTPVQVE